MIKNVIGYVRISKGDKEAERSLENQKELILKICKGNKYNLFGIEVDFKKTGRNLERNGIQNVIKKIKNKEVINYIICVRLDRLTRNVDDFKWLIREILNPNNIKIISTLEEDGFDKFKELDYLDCLEEVIYFSKESDIISKKVRRVFQYKKSIGQWIAPPPLGFKYDSSGNGKLIIDNEKIEIIERIKFLHNEEKLSFKKISEITGIPKTTVLGYYHISIEDKIKKYDKFIKKN